MRNGRASTTAKMVAMWRAFADAGATSVPNFRDPYAAELLTGGFRLLTIGGLRGLRRLDAASRVKAGRQPDPIPIRVAVIDAELLAAVKAGCRQVVILGAGFDTRAWRFEELAGTTVFEVDHPATQALKQERAARLPPPKARLVWTAVDFQHESLSDRLSAVGHDPAVPTVWIWEGVVMYLADEAVSATLKAVRDRSAPSSVLVLHYHEPGVTGPARSARKRIFSWLGEPQIGLRTRGEMHRLVEQAGFAVRADLDIAAQAAMVGATASDSDLARVSRILVAR